VQTRTTKDDDGNRRRGVTVAANDDGLDDCQQSAICKLHRMSFFFQLLFVFLPTIYIYMYRPLIPSYTLPGADDNNNLNEGQRQQRRTTTATDDEGQLARNDGFGPDDAAHIVWAFDMFFL
jgi:hypothetical protein